MKKSKKSSRDQARELAIKEPLPDSKKTIEIEIVQNFEGLVLGAEMFTLGDDEGSMMTGSGFGSDAIVMEWHGRRALVRGKDLFTAWVATWDPDSAKRMS